MNSSVRKSYRRGVWLVRILPFFFFTLWSAGAVWLALDGYITYTISLYGIAVMLVLMFLWSQYQIGRWKLWMVEHAKNPKTVLEKARDGFLKVGLLENLALMTPSSRKLFHLRYNERMADLTSSHLKTAAAKYDVDTTISVHSQLAKTGQLLLFEIIVGATVVFLYIYQSGLTIRIISGFLLGLSIIGIFYTLKSLWRKNKTVLEVSRHGLRIDDKYYGWIELEVVDIVKGNTLVYKTHHGEKQQRRIDDLSMPADYLDELILFYRTTHVKTHVGTSS